MKTLTQLLLLCFSLLLMSAGCRKNKPENELDKLPPITQTGAHTFGCLINGKAYIPKGFRFKPNFQVIVDPGFRDGDVSIRTYRIENNTMVTLDISSDSIRAEGTYLIRDRGRTQNLFVKSSDDYSQIYCQVPYGSTHQRKGYLKITKYDLQNGIISGEFEVSMVNKDCGLGDVISITNGRFDYKL